MNEDKKILKRDVGVRNRVFSYTKGDVSLSFTLRTDIKQSMKDFVELLTAALADVKEELAQK